MVKTWVESNGWYLLSGMNLLSICKTKGLWKKKTDKHAPERKGKRKYGPRSDQKSGSLGFFFKERSDVSKKGLFFIYFHITDPQYQRYFGEK